MRKAIAVIACTTAVICLSVGTCAGKRQVRHFAAIDGYGVSFWLPEHYQEFSARVVGDFGCREFRYYGEVGEVVAVRIAASESECGEFARSLASGGVAENLNRSPVLLQSLEDVLSNPSHNVWVAEVHGFTVLVAASAQVSPETFDAVCRSVIYVEDVPWVANP